MYQSLITPNVVTVIFEDGESRSAFAHQEGRFKAVVDAVAAKKSEAEVRAVLDGRTFISSWSCGNFSIVDNKLTWSGRPDYPVPEVLAARLMAFADKGYPADAFVKFLEKLLANPSKRSIETFFGFIENQGLTIDAEGDVIGYKGVTIELKDCHTGTIDNSPGQHPKMDRSLVDDDPRNECSTGFHFGGWDYAHSFGPRMVLVKVNPADLVCVPYDCSQGKVRVCEYTVLKEVTPESKMKEYYEAGLLGEDGKALPPAFPNGEVECPDCGTTNDAKANFCRGCGMSLVATECPSCKAPRIQGAPFCSNCGTKY